MRLHPFSPLAQAVQGERRSIFLWVLCVVLPLLVSAQDPATPFRPRPGPGWTEVTDPAQPGDLRYLQREEGSPNYVLVVLRREVLQYGGQEELGPLLQELRRGLETTVQGGLSASRRQVQGLEAVVYSGETEGATLHFVALPRRGEVFVFMVAVPGPAGAFPSQAQAFLERLEFSQGEVLVNEATAETKANQGAALGGLAPVPSQRGLADWALELSQLPPLGRLAVSVDSGGPSCLAAGVGLLAGETAAKQQWGYREARPRGFEQEAELWSGMLVEAGSLVSSQAVSMGLARRAWEEAVLAAQYGDEQATQEALALVRGQVQRVEAADRSLRHLAARSQEREPLLSPLQAQETARRQYLEDWARALLVLEQEANPGEAEYHKGAYRLQSVRWGKHLKQGEGPSAQQVKQDGPSSARVFNPNDLEEETPAGQTYVQSLDQKGRQVLLSDYYGHPTVRPYRLHWQVPEQVEPGLGARLGLEVRAEGSLEGWSHGEVLALELADAQGKTRSFPLAEVSTQNPNYGNCQVSEYSLRFPEIPLETDDRRSLLLAYPAEDGPGGFAVPVFQRTTKEERKHLSLFAQTEATGARTK